jgi:hypothetical protein
MRVFKVSDGTSWTARIDDGGDDVQDEQRPGWEAIVFEASVAAAAQRLVYRPPGWLQQATARDLTAALEEGVTVRVKWGG